jgi:hypothetical protein
VRCFSAGLQQVAPWLSEPARARPALHQGHENSSEADKPVIGFLFPPFTVESLSARMHLAAALLALIWVVWTSGPGSLWPRQQG